MNESPAAGWYSDPSGDARLRYWDGQGWTEHYSPSVSEPQQVPPTTSASPSTTPAPEPTPHFATHAASDSTGMSISTKWKIGAGVAVGLLVIGALVDGDSDDEPAEAAALASATKTTAPATPAASAKPKAVAKAKPKKAKKPSALFGNQPGDQKRFVSIVAKARKESNAASNDLKKGVALSNRNQDICKMLGSGAVSNWSGKITELDSNGDGFGIVTIEVAKDVEVTTWNNAFSDAVDETLIKPGKLLNDLAEREKGDVVRFSGQFVEELGGDPCVNDSRMTKHGKVNDPQFIFRFSQLSK